ncbi:MAG: hypothetical protein ACRENG_36720, partial [bacterium]
RYIETLIKRQALFQNNPEAGELAFGVVDGFPVEERGILIKQVHEDVQTLVLATDGYPILANSLSKTEKLLRAILREDRLLFRKYKYTKGKGKGQNSFDDRAYLKILLQNKSLV